MNISLYDAYYYEHGCGRPYQRDDGWLEFFDGIATRIIEQSEPKTVLDAGCAWGFLVEALRKHGVDGFGIDISDYAIEHVYPDMRPYCWVGSITESFPQKYDLITCIEVLEHMPKDEGEKAIRNLCGFTDEIVFSSTPLDYKEATHFNVQPPEYWAEQFARYGFYRDLEVDLSFITPWAVKFVRINRPITRLVREYERKFWYLWKENTDLRLLSSEMRSQVSDQYNQIQALNRQITSLVVQVPEIQSSMAWRIVRILQKVRAFWIPYGSKREYIAKLLAGKLSTLLPK